MEQHCDNGNEMAFSYGKEVRWRCSMREFNEEKQLRMQNYLMRSKLTIETNFHFICFQLIKWRQSNFVSQNWGWVSTVVNWNNCLRDNFVCRFETFTCAQVNLLTKHSKCLAVSKKFVTLNVPDGRYATLLPLALKRFRLGAIFILGF